MNAFSRVRWSAPILLLSFLGLPTVAIRGVEAVAILTKAVAATNQTKADFTQRFTPKGFSREQVEAGSVVFGRLPEMRWSYTTPESKTFVFDGTTSWFYSAEDQQLTIHKLTDGEKRDLPLVVLSDPAQGLSAYEITSKQTGTTVRIELRPKDSAATIRNCVVTVDAARGTISGLEWDDREGNHTVFEFTTLGPAEIGPDSFRFEAPPGTEVVEN